MAIKFLLEDNRENIKRMVIKMRGGEQDAENVLIEGVTSMVFNIRKKKFKGDSAISTYLYSICRRIWLKSLNKESRYVDWEEGQSSEATEDSPFSVYSDEQLKKDVYFLLGKLGDACQTVLRMWAGHYSMTEIAEKMNYKNAQVAMNKKNKCFKKLKEVALNNADYRKQLTSYLS